MTVSYEEMSEALSSMLDELPEEIFAELNGGVSLLEYKKTNPISDSLLICGEYHVEPHGLGRYITLYYDSIMAAYSHMNRESILREVKRVLHHELTHHLENLAGDRTLEEQDKIDIARMLGGDLGNL